MKVKIYCQISVKFIKNQAKKFVLFTLPIFAIIPTTAVVVFLALADIKRITMVHFESKNKLSNLGYDVKMATLHLALPTLGVTF